MKSLNRKVVILTVFILANVSFADTYSGGFGTETDPYQIGTVTDWQELMADSNDWDANFIMIADINLQGIPLIPVGNDLNSTNSVAFTGVFDGNGHIIRNAAINMPGQWHIGLFGIIDSNSQIKNLGVEDVNMNGERDVAGLAGLSKGTITNCYATGKAGSLIYGIITANPAGLVGLNYGTVTHCHAACDVNGRYAGGLVGRNYGTISDSYANGTVYGFGYLGGLVGWNFGHIIDSYADGEVNGATYGGDSVGGLVGKNWWVENFNGGPDANYIGTIARCYAACSVSGNRYVGGLVGINGEIPYIVSSITNCYATGTVTGRGSVGGLLGKNEGHTTNCYASGKVTGSGGGLDSSGNFPTSNCFWDIEATGQTTSGSGTGKTTAEMKTLSTFKSAGWDFVDTWGIGENQTYPFLRTYSGADLTYDGLVNFNDFAIWADHWLEGI